MANIFPTAVLGHWLILVSALRVLMQPNISKTMLYVNADSMNILVMYSSTCSSLLVGCSSTSHKNIVNDESTLIKFDDDFVVRGNVFWWAKHGMLTSDVHWGIGC